MLNLAKFAQAAAVAAVLGTSLLSSALITNASSPPGPQPASTTRPSATLLQAQSPIPDNRLGAVAEMVAELSRQTNGDPDRFVRLSFREGIPLKATQQV